MILAIANTLQDGANELLKTETVNLHETYR